MPCGVGHPTGAFKPQQRYSAFDQAGGFCVRAHAAGKGVGGVDHHIELGQSGTQAWHPTESTDANRPDWQARFRYAVR